MDKVPFTNNLTHCVHVGGAMIAPGSTRLVDPRDLAKPGVSAKPKASIPPPESPILGLLDARIADVTAALPELTADQLDELEQAEANGKTRKGVIEALAAERLRRAAESDA